MYVRILDNMVLFYSFKLLLTETVGYGTRKFSAKATYLVKLEKRQFSLIFSSKTKLDGENQPYPFTHRDSYNIVNSLMLNTISEGTKHQ